MLTFDESRHVYHWDGKEVPSVTAILSPLLDFSMVPEEVLERGRQLGQAVHKMTELYDQDDLDMDSLTPEMLPFLEGWKKFRAECDFVPDTIEARGYHPTFGYCGTWDRTGSVRGRKAVIDIKKMAALGPVIGLQLAAYQALYNLDKLKEPLLDRYALGLRQDGTYRLEQYTNQADFSVFLSLLTIRNWKERHGIRH